MGKEFSQLFRELSQSNARVLKDYGAKISLEHQEKNNELVKKVLTKLDKLDVLDDLKNNTKSTLSGSAVLPTTTLAPYTSSSSSLITSQTSIGKIKSNFDNKVTPKKVYEIIEKYEPIDSLSIKGFFEVSLREVERLIRTRLKDRVFYYEKYNGYRVIKS